VVLAVLERRCVLLQHGARLLAVDPVRLRAHMVELRLRASLSGTAGATDAPAQLLLSPVVVHVAATDVELVVARAAELRRLGLWAEPFGAAAIAVRAVPAAVEHCAEPGEVRALLERVLPWLRLRADATALVRAIASADGPDPTARLVRRWIGELAHAGALERGDPPGVRSWGASELLAGHEGER
jgi:DNA mismatch repair ATPase MutL